MLTILRLTFFEEATETEKCNISQVKGWSDVHDVLRSRSTMSA